jgi:hypothetical protein
MVASLYITFAITVSKRYNVFFTLLKNPQCQPYNDRTIFAGGNFLDFKSLVIQLSLLYKKLH